ncbi:MAG: flagellar basal body rod protein FlgB [Sulfuricella sp.]|nr:flagellar basal body rod protein FlgB [Sulfuricella sp.]
MVSHLDTEFKFLQKSLDLRAYRQQVLASNIANADTPSYKSRDFDFSSELDRAMGGQTSKLEMRTTSSRHLQSKQDNPLGVDLKYRSSVQPSIDGNTVDMDVERSQFTDNALHYQFSVDRISGKVKQLLSAIQGQSQ